MKIGNWKMKIKRRCRGSYLPVILMASVLFMAFSLAIISLSMSNVKIANLHNSKITSMSIAEAGINYYLWHLSHNNEDYCDGNETCNSTDSFTHDYIDQSGKVLGTYQLFITPPSAGQASITVKSVGKVNGKSPTRTIVTSIGMPSYTKYTLLIDGNPLNIGTGAKIDGSVHVNNAILNNGGEITGDASSTEANGVTGGGVFGGAKLFPVPPVDFVKLDNDILKIRDLIKTDGVGWYGSSGSSGYHIVLKDGTYDLSRVTKYDNNGYMITKETFLGNHAYPDRGVIFCEDNVWIEGTVNEDKISIFVASPGVPAGQSKKMYITNPVKYINVDGRDKIGLVSQSGIFLAQNVPTDMTIDAAMISMGKDSNKNNNLIGIKNYNEKKNKLTIYGSMATQSAVFKYLSGNTFVSGFANRDIIMDTFNVLNPPPKFPLTGTYVILSWREE